MSIRLNAALGGSISIEETNTAGTFTLTLPALTGSFVVADTNGNVGIGVTPLTKLHIGGTATAELRITSTGSVAAGGSLYAITRYGGSNNELSGYVGFGGTANALDIWNSLAGSIIFGTSALERGRFTSNGELYIATGTTNYTTENGFRFYPAGSANGGFVAFTNSGNGGSNLALVNANASTTSWTALFFAKQGTTVGAISCTGSVTSYGTSSDYRLKIDPIPLTGSLDRVMQLEPKQWKWKADGTTGVGFIAHEVQSIRPQAVIGTKDAVDEKGDPIYQGMDASFLIADLTGAIQEQQTIIDELRSRIETLEQV